VLNESDKFSCLSKNEYVFFEKRGFIMTLNRRHFLRSLGVGIGALGFTEMSCSKEQSQPNILFIMSDDHATNAISCYGSRLSQIAPTPNIDRIAREGSKLINCFCTNSICTPSRASILTGKYSHLNGVYTLQDALDPQQQKVAKFLGQAGYQTAMIGKWHLKTEPSGFDYWNVLPGQGRYFNPVLKEKGTGEHTYEGHSTDLITNFSIDWLAKRKVSKPFFLMCHFKAPHEPWEYPKRLKDYLADVEIPEPESLWEDKTHRSDGSREYGFTLETMAERQTKKKYHSETPLDKTGKSAKEIRKEAYQIFLKRYLRTITGVDENVGRLLDYLEKNGLAENTVVIYTSDQGYFLGEHNYIDKRWMYEESLRMPFLVRYPKEIKPETTSDEIVINTDFAPLFLDYAKVEPPEDMQGKSFRPILSGNKPGDWRQSMYYRYWLHTTRPAHYGIRTKKHKLIFFYGLGLGKKGADITPTKVGWELYDLEKDPKEMNNVYNDPKYSKIVAELKMELLSLKKELKDEDEKYPELMKVRELYWES
jgi:arylsulfatase A-like enzyme